MSPTYTCGRRCQLGGEASPGLSSRSACELWRRSGSGKASADQWPVGGSLDTDSSATVPGAAARDASCEMLPLEPHLRAAPCATRRIQEWNLTEHFCVSLVILEKHPLQIQRCTLPADVVDFVVG
jgi:hypothetical protein